MVLTTAPLGFTSTTKLKFLRLINVLPLESRCTALVWVHPSLEMSAYGGLLKESLAYQDQTTVPAASTSTTCGSFFVSLAPKTKSVLPLGSRSASCEIFGVRYDQMTLPLRVIS